ncbi:MAG TPA: acyl-CoA reductase [Thermoanaerobaculia bacterium]|nr:acyl-CoA reductase [Thermoanaerobaculia bacterium]
MMPMMMDEEALRAIPSADLLAAWGETVEAFLDPGSPERRALDPELARTSRLSPEGLAAALEAVLGGVRTGPAAALLAEAEGMPSGGGPVLAVLASNLPALAVQPLWPALALRRPILIKSPSAEPVFVPAFLAALTRREPRLEKGVAAATWRGGDERVEAPILEQVATVIAYGDEPALADLERRAPGKVVGYGPKTSLAVVAEGEHGRPRTDTGSHGRFLESEMSVPDRACPSAASGLARDIALFDQRGCLSVAAVYVSGNAEELAVRLEEELAELARRWPPGPADPAALAAVQQARLEAEMRGLRRTGLPILSGTVLVDPNPTFRPSPGLRTVRVHPMAGLDRLPEILSPWRGKLQGAALAGEGALLLVPALAGLGISRHAAPGDLQSPDVTWHNGGVHPLHALSVQQTQGSSR